MNEFSILESVLGRTDEHLVTDDERKQKFADSCHRVARRENRIKLFSFTDHNLMEVLNGKLVLSPGQFPDDARILRINYDLFIESFVISVCSSEYEKIPDGARLKYDSRLKFESK